MTDHHQDDAISRSAADTPSSGFPPKEAILRGLRLYFEDLQRAGVQHLLMPVSSGVVGDWSGEPADSNAQREAATPSPGEAGPSTSADSASTLASEPVSPAMPKKQRAREAASRKEPPAESTAVPGTEQLSLLGGTGQGWQSVRLPEGKSREEILAELARQVAQCVRCPALVANRTQTVFGVGNPYAELVFIGEAPGYDEDVQGLPFVGRAGQLLTAMITNGMGMRREDVYICNILRCRPPNNRTPTREEAANCRPWLDATLAVIEPKFICCLGNVAAQNLLGTDLTIGRLRGKIWEYNGAKVVCTYHPAFLLRNPAMKREAWEDLKLLLQVMGRPIPRRSTPDA
ncbi:uracil-DNA glycosylase family protein [Thermogutta sp.]|uniref:uracil-DNA glycosylase n=1 Tax=Thermogutta sp. TaxID=1962930 RepID=UPI0025D3BDFC|nr:uracil-DNA glycosylase family protein [Thermogutta sp.]